jgi:hypothetical protein
MLLGNSNLWLNLREIQINSVLLIGQLELFITKNPLYPVLFFKRYCFQLSPRKTHCKFDPRVLGHPVCFQTRWKRRDFFVIKNNDILVTV